MAGRGPAPKPAGERRRRNPVAVVESVVVPDAVLRGRELPGEFAWCSQTHKWWDTWRGSAQAQAFTDSDWDFLLDTALLHHLFWEGDRSVAAELRLRVAKFGATPEDRARLRMSVGEPPKPGKGAVPGAASAGAPERKARLLRLVSDGGASA